MSSKNHGHTRRPHHAKLKSGTSETSVVTAALNTGEIASHLIEGRSMSVAGGKEAIKFANAISNLPESGSKPTAQQLNNVQIARNVNFLKP